METSSCNPNVDSVESNLEHILCRSQTWGDLTTPLENLDMENHFEAVRATDLFQNPSAQVSQEVAPNAPEEEKIEEELEKSEMTTFETLYTISKDVQNMIKATLKVHE